MAHKELFSTAGVFEGTFECDPTPGTAPYRTFPPPGTFEEEKKKQQQKNAMWDLIC